MGRHSLARSQIVGGWLALHEEAAEARSSVAERWLVRAASSAARGALWRIGDVPSCRLRDRVSDESAHLFDAAGEGDISAWEYGRGIRPLGWYVGAIVMTGFVMGLCIAPRLTLCAWRNSGRAPSLFHQPDREYDALLDLTIGGLRELLALAREGLAMRRRGLNELAPRR